MPRKKKLTKKQQIALAQAAANTSKVMQDNLTDMAATPIQTERSLFEKIQINNSSDLFKYCEEFAAKGLGIISERNRKYASYQDPFRNFKKHGLKGILVRLDDKFARLDSIVNDSFIQDLFEDESVMDTLHDIANYCALFAALLYQEQFNASNSSR